MKTKLILLLMVLMPSFGIAQDAKIDVTLKAETLTVVIKNISANRIYIRNQSRYNPESGSNVLFNSYDASGKLLKNKFVCISKKDFKTYYYLDAGQEFSYSYDLKKAAPSFNEAAKIKMEVKVGYISDNYYKYEKTLVYNKKTL